MKNEIIDYKVKKEFNTPVTEAAFDKIKKQCFKEGLDLKSVLIATDLMDTCEPVFKLQFGGLKVTPINHYILMLGTDMVGSFNALLNIYNYFKGQPIFVFGSKKLEFVEFADGYWDALDSGTLPARIQIGDIVGTWEELVNIIKHYHD